MGGGICKLCGNHGHIQHADNVAASLEGRSAMDLGLTHFNECISISAIIMKNNSQFTEE